MGDVVTLYLRGRPGVVEATAPRLPGLRGEGPDRPAAARDLFRQAGRSRPPVVRFAWLNHETTRR